MSKYILILILVPLIGLSQSGISVSGSSQFNIGETIFPLDNNYIPISYEQRNNSVTLSLFRGRKFRIGTIALKGSLSYNIEKTKYQNNINNPVLASSIDNYKTIKRSLIPSLEIWHIFFQNEKTFLYASIGGYGIIQNLNFENDVYEYNSLVPFLRTGVQLNYNRFFLNPFISFDLEQIRFNSFTDIFNADMGDKIKNYSIRTGLECGILF